jgi:hypothetical protein
LAIQTLRLAQLMPQAAAAPAIGMDHPEQKTTRIRTNFGLWGWFQPRKTKDCFFINSDRFQDTANEAKFNCAV